VTSAEYQALLDSLPYGKRLPGAISLLDPGSASDALPAKLRVTVAELRKRLDIGPDFKLLKFHSASAKISLLAYPAFDKDPHPALAESIIVDLVTGKIRRDDYRGREAPQTRLEGRNHRPRYDRGGVVPFRSGCLQFGDLGREQIRMRRLHSGALPLHPLIKRHSFGESAGSPERGFRAATVGRDPAARLSAQALHLPRKHPIGCH
jgi:hypothetical protein